jgi:hypothetical protein
MLVVGAPLLEIWWRKRPEAEEPLRALHALLARTPAAEADRLLAGAKAAAGGARTVAVAGAAIRLRINGPAGLVLIEAVEDAE